MNTKDLDKIAQDLIAAKLAAGDEVQMDWAVHEMITSQGIISGDAVPFYTLCAREHCYRVVKKVVEKYDAPEESDPKQMKMQGFEHLQVAYTVERNSERILVPIEHLSNEELLARAEQYDRQADGLVNHADELRRYVARRMPSAAAAR